MSVRLVQLLNELEAIDVGALLNTTVRRPEQLVKHPAAKVSNVDGNSMLVML